MSETYFPCRLHPRRTCVPEGLEGVVAEELPPDLILHVFDGEGLAVFLSAWGMSGVAGEGMLKCERRGGCGQVYPGPSTRALRACRSRLRPTTFRIPTPESSCILKSPTYHARCLCVPALSIFRRPPFGSFVRSVPSPFRLALFVPCLSPNPPPATMVQCSGMTQHDTPCKRQVNPTKGLLYPRAAARPLYCHDHLAAGLENPTFRCLKHQDMIIDYDGNYLAASLGLATNVSSRFRLFGPGSSHPGPLTRTDAYAAEQQRQSRLHLRATHRRCVYFVYFVYLNILSVYSL